VIVGPPDSAVALGVPYRVEAAGFSPDHTGVEVPVLEWRVADSSVAAISAQGIVTGKRSGRTTVYASAGGWRGDSIIVRVVARRETAELSEAWTTSWGARWRPFGEPQPRVVRGPAGPALFVAGDSSYYSGVYSQTTFAADSGLGVRAIVRTPVPFGKWQVLRIGLLPLQDSLALRRWDHRTANLPLNSEDVSRDCEVKYPTSEALWGRRFVALSVARVELNVPVDTTLASGKRWELTLQLLPDGRCAVAVNGEALRISALGVSTDLPRHVVADGQSVRTRMLVDHLEVWRGVRQDIDWNRVDSSAVRHRAGVPR
jgi:hypothetical protein